MSMIIQHNIQAMNSSRMLGITTGLQAKSTEKLASGYRINRAADDAAGLAISEKMRKKIRGLNRGQDNTMDGISFVQVGDGAMGQVADMIQRMNVLAVQAANGTNSASDREAIQGEVSHLKKEIDRINETTKFNEMNVFLQDEPNIAEVELSVTGKPDTHDDLNFFRDDNGNAAGIMFTATGSSGKILMQIFMMQKQIHFIKESISGTAAAVFHTRIPIKPTMTPRRGQENSPLNFL